MEKELNKCIPEEIQKQIWECGAEEKIYDSVYRVSKRGMIDKEAFKSTYEEILAGQLPNDENKYPKNKIGTYSTSVYTDIAPCKKFMTYFEDVLEYGDLKVEKVLFMFDNLPIIFVCTDSKKRRYLCQCTDVILGYSWMITQITYEILFRMIQNEISVLDAFKKSGHLIIIAERMSDGKMDYRKMKFDDIDDDDLPDPDEKLDNPNLNNYIQFLREQEIKEEENIYSIQTCGILEEKLLRENNWVEAPLAVFEYVVCFSQDNFEIASFDKQFREKTKERQFKSIQVDLGENETAKINKNYNRSMYMERTICV